MIKQITLNNSLPRVFAGMEKSPQIANSQIWLTEQKFSAPGFYLISAESGTGKSSLCSFIYGVRGDYSGQILFDGRPISQLSVAEWCDLRTHSLAYLPQHMMLFPELTVLENIDIKNRLTSFRSKQWIADALDALEIADKASSKAAHLSIGQQQRVAIIRALCQPFSFLLLDEPVSHLDARNNQSAATLIAQAAAEQGAAVIATSVGNHLNLNFNTLLQL